MIAFLIILEIFKKFCQAKNRILQIIAISYIEDF